VSLEYDDFDLEITPAGDKYRVHLNGPTGQAAADFVLPFTDVDVSNFLSRIGQVRRSMRRAEAPELHAAKDFGGKLFGALFTGELIAQLRGSVEQSLNNDRGLRIRLRLTDVPELADLPWEFLYDSAQNHFLTTSTETPLVRFLDLPQRIAPVRATLPLRVLVVIASPKNLKRLDAEGEWQRLQDALADLLRGGHIVLERLPSATIDALRLRARGAPFHIFHFIGHGGFDIVAEDGVLQFEDENGMSYPVRGEMLGMQLHDHRSLRLAVLNACEGARSSRQDPFSGVAQSLLQQRVPAVIAMQFEISDAAAKVFAREFYCAIAEGNPVDAAVCESRKALFNEEFGQEWATPVLYMRSHEGQLFDLQGPAAAVLYTSSVDRERADAERRAAEIAAAERAATAEKEREETERSEQARLAANKAEALRRLAQKAQAESVATSEKVRQAQEQAERERLASEKADAERRATEKAETERAAAEAEQQRQTAEQMAGAKLARAATPSEPLAAQTPPAPLPAALASPPPTPRRGLPMWQILLLFIPFVGLVLALSWHHLRPHSETARSPETPASEAHDTNPEPRASQMSSAIAAPKHPAEVSPKSDSQEEPPSPKPPSAASPNPNKGNLAPSKATNANTKPNEKHAAAEKPAAPPPLGKSGAPSPRLRITWIAQKAKIVSQVSAVYPPEAIQGNITGVVELDVIIAKDGTVQSAAATSGQPLLAQAAIDSVKQWRFSPTMVNNQPVEIETAVPFTFNLKKSEPAPSTASAAQTPPAKSAPCTFGRVDFQDAGTRLVGAVPYTYTGSAQVQTLALVGIPMTADKKEIPGVSLGETTLQVPSGTASFSIDAHPSLGKTGAQGDSVLVMVVVKSTNEMVCSKLVPYPRTW
jgi:TonB family protein